MDNRDISVAFTGHRTEKLPQTPQGIALLKERLQDEILEAISKGFRTFYIGMAYGFDLIAGATVLDLKQEYSLKLIGAVPFPKQATRISSKDKDEYDRILSLCDEVIVCSEMSRRGIYHQRNRLMVNRSSLLIAYRWVAVYGGLCLETRGGS